MSSLSPGENDAQGSPSAVVKIRDVSLSYGKTRALDAVSLNIPAGIMVGLIGPDGVGKSSLLSLIAGAHKVQDGHIEVLGGDIADKKHRDRTCPQIAYMPQGLGKTSTRRCRCSRISSSLRACSAGQA